MSNNYTPIRLKQDNGSDLTFNGRIFSECTWFHEGLGEMIKQRLYITDTNEQVYYIVRSNQTEKSRRAFRFSVDGDRCIINNGKATICLQLDALMDAVRRLAGLSEKDVVTQNEILETMQTKVMNG